MKKIILYTGIVLFLTSCGFSNKGLIDSTKVSNIEIAGENNVIEDKNEKIEEIVPMSHEYIALMKNKSIEKWKGSKLEEIDGWVDIQMKNYITQNVELTQKKEESLKDKIILKDYGNGFKLMYSDTKVYIFHNGNNIFEKDISLFFLTLDCKKGDSCPTTLNTKSLKALKIYTNRAVGLKHFSGNFYIINENMYEGSYSYFYDSKNIKIFKEKGDSFEMFPIV